MCFFCGDSANVLLGDKGLFPSTTDLLIGVTPRWHHPRARQTTFVPAPQGQGRSRSWSWCILGAPDSLDQPPGILDLTAVRISCLLLLPFKSVQLVRATLLSARDVLRSVHCSRVLYFRLVLADSNDEFQLKWRDSYFPGLKSLFCFFTTDNVPACGLHGPETYTYGPGHESLLKDR